MTTLATTGTVYALLDPRSGAIRYIGQTTKPIEVRLAGHLAAPAPRVRAWIDDLAVEGRTPEIVALHEGVPADQLDRVEREEIKVHAEQGDLLNTAGNEPGNAKRRVISQKERKRRAAEEEAMRLKWQAATWRQVADQIRDATGGPISPADIPIREIPTAVWQWYQVYRDLDQKLAAKSNKDTLLRLLQDQPLDSETESLVRQRRSAKRLLENYLRAYCGAFTAVDEGERWGAERRILDRGVTAYESHFRSPDELARFLSFIPWAARALDPWIVLAEQAGMNIKSAEFADWVSGDEATRNAVELYRTSSPGWMGLPRQQWDIEHARYMLAAGAAHIPGFVTPEPLMAALGEKLRQLAEDRQATREMCTLLRQINPGALDAVYGKDELAASDAALGLPTGTSADVIRQIYGGDSRDPNDRAARLLQRHSGEFDVVAIPGYAGWSGPHVPGTRAAIAAFCSAGLLDDTDAGEELLRKVKATWMPTARGLEDIEGFDARLRDDARGAMARAWVEEGGLTEAADSFWVAMQGLRSQG